MAGLVMANRVLLAPAKINICLHVCGRRADGYHELGMIMQRVSLCDRVEVCLAGNPGVRVVCPELPLVAGEENIAARAARRMLQLSGRDVGVEIRIDKRIPVAAGLGGGSSDAAAVLLTLDEMLDLRLGREALMREGARIGADVPFFIYQDTAWATGIGEILDPFPLPPVWYLLVNPNLAISTAWVYGNLGLTSPGPVAKMPGFPKTAEELTRLLHNDLERVTMRRYPLLADIREQLLANGASGALMSGSGPTMFGVFLQEEEAHQAADRLLADHPDWKVFVVRPFDPVVNGSGVS